MTPTELDELERAARAATPEPWRARESKIFGLAESTGGPADPVLIAQDVYRLDEEFIALANPSTILALVAEVRRLREEAASLWPSGHMANTACADDGERDGRCVSCGKANPYLIKPQP